MVLVRSGWMLSSVKDQRPDSLTVLTLNLVLLTVHILKILESSVLQVRLIFHWIILTVHLPLPYSCSKIVACINAYSNNPSLFTKAAVPLELFVFGQEQVAVGVWKCATIISGAQYVTTFGIL